MSVILKNLTSVSNEIAKKISGHECYCRHPYLKCGVCTDRERSKEKELQNELKRLYEARENAHLDFLRDLRGVK